MVNFNFVSLTTFLCNVATLWLLDDFLSRLFYLNKILKIVINLLAMP